MILAVTGHRPPKVGGYQIPNRVEDAILRSLDEMFIRLMPTHVYSGMALGVDQWAAQLCIRNSIPFTAVIPFDGYESRWPDESKDLYNTLLSRAARVRVLASAPPAGAAVDVMIRNRNRWVVREAEALLAVFNGDAHSGTGQTLAYAAQLQRPIYNASIPPHLWAEARNTYERLEARKALRQAQNTGTHVRRRTPTAAEPPGRWSEAFRERQEAFAAGMASASARVVSEKRLEQVREDVANLKPRRVIDIGDD